MIKEIIQYFDKSPFPRYSVLMENIKRVAERNNIKYSLILGRPEYIKRKELSWFYDSISVRLKELSERENCLWLDSDCEIMDENFFGYNFKTDRPYIFGKNCSSSAMFNNGFKKHFETILENFKYGNGCICLQYLRFNMDKFNILPEGFIKHLKMNGGHK